MPRYLKKIPLFISVIYLFFGSLWVLFTDKILSALVSDRSALIRIQTLKGWFYVALTAGLLYLMLKFFMNKEIRFKKNLLKSMKEQEILLHELQHRVRNNLQMMDAWINLQRMELSNPACEKPLQNLSFRLRALDWIHSRLFEPAPGQPLRLSDYFRSLLQLTARYRETGPITFSFSGCEEIPENREQALSLGLLTSELLGCFFNSREASPQKSLQIRAERVFELSDDLVFEWNAEGVEFETLPLNHPHSLEFQMIEALRHQIGASLSIAPSGKQTVLCQIRFALKPISDERL